MQLQDYINDVQELLHDQIGVSWSQPRLISRINEARLYASMDMKCVRSLVQPMQLIAGQEVYTLGAGVVAGVAVLTPGSNYGTGTLPLTFTGGQTGGVGVTVQNASAFATLVAGQVSSITMLGMGLGYTSAPTVTITGPGSGATFAPVMITNLLYPISLTYFFNGVRTTLRYLPFSLFQAYARVLGSMFQSTPGVWTWQAETRNIYVQPPPNQNYVAELDATFMTSPLVALTDTDFQLVDPWDKAVQFGAASLLFMKDQDAGRARAEYHARNYAQMVPRVVTGVGGVRVPNIYNRSFQRMVAR